jgi:hypothetical protein
MSFTSSSRRHSFDSLSARAFSLALLTATVSSPSAFATDNQAVSATTDESPIRTAQVASAQHMASMRAFVRLEFTCHRRNLTICGDASRPRVGLTRKPSTMILKAFGRRTYKLSFGIGVPNTTGARRRRNSMRYRSLLRRSMEWISSSSMFARAIPTRCRSFSLTAGRVRSLNSSRQLVR